MKTAANPDEQGLTLVELMVAVVVMAMVIAVTSSLYVFGSRVFRTGEAQAWLQSSGESALRVMTPKVRNATALDIMSSKPASFDSGWWYVYLLDPAQFSTRVIMRSPDGDERQITDEIVSGSDGLSFEARLVGQSVILSITVRGSYRGRAGEAVATAILGNISSLPSHTTGSSVRFKVPN